MSPGPRCDECHRLTPEHLLTVDAEGAERVCPECLEARR